MHIQSLKTCALALLAAASFASAASAQDAPAPFNKWRIELSGGRATDAGQVQFRVTPQQGEAILVTAQIANGRGEMAIAHAIHEAFKKDLPMKRFSIDLVAAQQVLLKTRQEEGDFLVELVDASIPGIHVHLKRG
jgi:uncharacterized protein (DUF849 family)